MNYEQIKTLPNKAIEVGKKLIPEFLKTKFEQKPKSQEEAVQKINERIQQITQPNIVIEAQITKLDGSPDKLKQKTSSVDNQLGDLKNKFTEMLGAMPVVQTSGGIAPKHRDGSSAEDRLGLNKTIKQALDETDAELNQPGAKQVLQVAEKIGYAPPGISKVGGYVQQIKNMFEGK